MVLRSSLAADAAVLRAITDVSIVAAEGFGQPSPPTADVSFVLGRRSVRLT